MKTEFDFDPSKCFDGRAGLCATVWPMHYPFLIMHAFGGYRQSNCDTPESLSVVLEKCCELIADDTEKPEHLRDLLKRCIKAGDSEAGTLGLGKLPLDELREGRAYVNTTLPLLPNARIQLRRFGDCIGIRVVNDRDEPHEKLAGILSRLAEDGRHFVRHFNQRYGFMLTPDLKGTGNSAYALDVQAELAVMNRYLPDIRWSGGKKLAALLGADFTGHERAGVKVGTYGDAEVFARITYERETNDSDWRLGKVRSTTATELVFGAGAGDKPQIEYFIQAVEPDRSFDPARGDIDYPREQGLMHDLARMLYAGLYQRGFQSMVDHGNSHFLRFRRESEQAAA